MASVFDPVPVPRADAEWRWLLAVLVDSLSAYVCVRFIPTSWRISDPPERPHADGSVDVRGVVNPALRLEACGTVWINAIDRKAAEVGAAVMLFSGGRRVLGPDGAGIVVLNYRADCWSSQGWVVDEFDAFAAHDTDAAWAVAERGNAPDPAN